MIHEEKSGFLEVILSVTIRNIQGNSRGKIRILGGDIIGHYEKYTGWLTRKDQDFGRWYYRSLWEIYRVIYEERSGFWQVILSVTMRNIQGDLRGKIRILRGDIVGHYEKYTGWFTRKDQDFRRWYYRSLWEIYRVNHEKRSGFW